MKLVLLTKLKDRNIETKMFHEISYAKNVIREELNRIEREEFPEELGVYHETETSMQAYANTNDSEYDFDITVIEHSNEEAILVEARERDIKVTMFSSEKQAEDELVHLLSSVEKNENIEDLGMYEGGRCAYATASDANYDWKVELFSDLLNEPETSETFTDNDFCDKIDTDDCEGLWLLEDGKWLYIQDSEEGYDYTFYESDGNDLDGGQFDEPEMSINEARTCIIQMHGLSGAVKRLGVEDIEIFLEMAEELDRIHHIQKGDKIFCFSIVNGECIHVTKDSKDNNQIIVKADNYEYAKLIAKSKAVATKKNCATRSA